MPFFSAKLQNSLFVSIQAVTLWGRFYSDNPNVD